ncbi:MAG: glycosyltransferase [Alicyclobacillus sp.]|nr:glycosyltransferase [Alicyclobacillus sp.]
MLTNRCRGGVHVAGTSFQCGEVPFSSIIILTHNKLAYTQACIESIREHTTPGTYEIIVVDNHSTDDTRAWLSAQHDIICIFNDRNVGFPAGCNQGIRAARGENIVLLNNDTVVTHNWLENLLLCLYSAEDIGAVGPVTNNSSYAQSIPVSYETLEEMHEFARNYNQHDPQKWEQRLKLVGFCLVVRRRVIDQVGLLDERFSPGNFEDDDFCLRVLKSGYRLMLCRDTFIHHYGSTTFKDNVMVFNQLLLQNAKKFKEKWGFDATYSMNIRYDILQLMNHHKRHEEIKVLEVGCACGGTLLQIKNMYPRARLYGIELNERAVEIASHFADVRAMDVEGEIDFDQDFFDYIIFADVLEHLYDPWAVVKKFRDYLSANGMLLASIPNVMHHSVIRDLINGNWTYTDAGLLDRTHIRFFTLREIDKMFAEAGYSRREYGAITLFSTESDKAWIKALAQISVSKSEDQFNAYQYLCKIWR